MLAFLSRERIVARPGFNRWLMLLAALGINIRVAGLTAAVAADWTLSTPGWIFTLAYVFLGLSAGVAGRLAGPRPRT